MNGSKSLTVVGIIFQVYHIEEPTIYWSHNGVKIINVIIGLEENYLHLWNILSQTT